LPVEAGKSPEALRSHTLKNRMKASTRLHQVTGWLGGDVAGRLTRWPKSHTADTVSRPGRIANDQAPNGA